MFLTFFESANGRLLRIEFLDGGMQSVDLARQVSLRALTFLSLLWLL